MARGWRRGRTGRQPWCPSAPASYAVWDIGEFEASAPTRCRASMVDRPAVAGAGAAAAGPDRPAAALPANGPPRRGDPWLRASDGSTAGSGPPRARRTPTFSRRSKTRSTTDAVTGDPSGRRTRLRRNDDDVDIDDVDDPEAMPSRRTSRPNRLTAAMTGRHSCGAGRCDRQVPVAPAGVSDRRPGCLAGPRDADTGAPGRPLATAAADAPGATVVAGLLLCASYPRFNWWWAAIVAFGVLAWVLTRPATTPVGGFGYGFLFGVAFYLPLMPWISIWWAPCRCWRWRRCARCFRGCSAWCAVTVRRLPGWPIWFAVLWAAQEWLKSTFPFGGFPWGVVAARSDRRAVAAAGPARRRAAAVAGDRAAGCSAAALGAGDRVMVAASRSAAAPPTMPGS